MTPKQWVLMRLPDARVDVLSRMGKWYQMWYTMTRRKGKLPRYKKCKLHTYRIFSGVVGKSCAKGTGRTEVEAWRNCMHRMISKGIK